MHSEVELRDGILHATAHGRHDVVEARQVLARQLELLDEHGLASAPLLVDTRKMDGFDGEARGVYAGVISDDRFDRVAIVTDSMFIRVAVNLVVRASGRADKARFFGDVTDAEEWLSG